VHAKLCNGHHGGGGGGGILSDLRQRVIGGIPGGAGKTDMWVVVATTMETRRKKKGNVGR